MVTDHARWFMLEHPGPDCPEDSRHRVLITKTTPPVLLLDSVAETLLGGEHPMIYCRASSSDVASGRHTVAIENRDLKR